MAPKFMSLCGWCGEEIHGKSQPMPTSMQVAKPGTVLSEEAGRSTRVHKTCINAECKHRKQLVIAQKARAVTRLRAADASTPVQHQGLDRAKRCRLSETLLTGCGSEALMDNGSEQVRNRAVLQERDGASDWR